MSSSSGYTQGNVESADAPLQAGTRWPRLWGGQGRTDCPSILLQEERPGAAGQLVREGQRKAPPARSLSQHLKRGWEAAAPLLPGSWLLCQAAERRAPAAHLLAMM